MSSAAFAHYRSLVEDGNRQPTTVRRDLDLTDATDTWWEVTELECYVFGIDPRLATALAWGLSRYHSMIGIEDEFLAFRAAERSAYPQYFIAERVYSLNHAAGFIASACHLPHIQARLYVARYEVQLARSGLMMEPPHAVPDWAVAQVVEPVGKDDPAWQRFRKELDFDM